MDNNIEFKKSDSNSSDNYEKINWIVKNADGNENVNKDTGTTLVLIVK